MPKHLLIPGLALLTSAVCCPGCARDDPAGFGDDKLISASLTGDGQTAVGGAGPGGSSTLRAPDPGAVSIMRELKADLVSPVGDEGARVISCSGLMDYSGRGDGDFRELMSELQMLLSHAGNGQIVLVANDKSAQFELAGAAYAIPDNRRGGWEIYLTVIDRRSKRVLWRSPGPIRVLDVGRRRPTRIVVNRR